MKLKLIIALLIIVNQISAQNVGINTTGATPNAKALLDIDAAGMSPKGGLLIPRLTTTERNAITAPIPMSLLIFNTTTECFEAWNQTNTSWVAFGCLGCQLPGAFSASAASGITQTTFAANWAASAGATTYYLDVATDAGFTSFVSGYNNLNVGNVLTTSVTGLSCATTYYYRLRANNTCGTSANLKSAILIGREDIDNFINHKISEYYGVTTIATFKNTTSALSHLVETDLKYEIILLDCILPPLDGLEFIDQFYELKLHKKHGKICVLSSSINPSDKQKCEERNVNYIEKPLSVEKLLDLENL